MDGHGIGLMAISTFTKASPDSGCLNSSSKTFNTSGSPNADTTTFEYFIFMIPFGWMG